MASFGSTVADKPAHVTGKKVERRSGMLGLACLLPALSICASLLLPSPGLAQQLPTAGPALSPSTFQSVDENGVELMSGRFNFKGPSLSAGAAPRQAQFPLSWNGFIWSFPSPSLWQDEYYDMYVDMGDAVDQLTGSTYSGGTYSGSYTYKPVRQNSSTMDCWVFINNYGPADFYLCSYAGHDGSSATFKFPYFMSDPPDFLLPNGNVKAYDASWCNAQGYCASSVIDDGGIQTIKVDGWTIKFTGLYSTSATAKLYSADNEIDSLTFSTPSANHDDRYDDSVLAPEGTTQVITQRDGSIWRFTFNGSQNMTGVRRPGSLTDDLTIGYDSDHRVTSLTNALGTWRYAYTSIDTDLKKTTVTKPDGKTYSVTYIKRRGNIRTYTDEFRRTTTYNYDTGNRLNEIIYPEQNRVVYDYDARGNIKTVTTYPKPGSAETPIVVQAEYTSDCTDRRNCNKPIAIVDARQKRTEYTYTAGFLATETKPAPNGTDARPQTRWKYADIEARALDPASQLVSLVTRQMPVEKSECLTTENCVGSADEIRTLYDYGPATGPNPAYLRGVSIVHNGQTRRTCYEYDGRGNRIVEREARANLSSCYSGAPSGNGPTFSVSDASATEGGNLSFTVTKTGSTSSALSVSYSTANGTATAGSDYNAASSTLSFAAADTTKTVTITTTDDTTAEGTETVLLNLSGATGGATISDTQGVGMIADNDGGGGGGGTCSGVSFSVSDNAQDEGNPLVFTVTKSGSTASSCSVNFATADGTAIAPNDYGAQSGTLTFGPSETTKTVSITTVIAGPNEPTEYMYLNLSLPSAGATITDSQGQGTLYNYYDGSGCPLC